MEKLEPLTIKIFYSYAQTKADRSLKDVLEKHLTALGKQDQIISWSKDSITAGRDKILEIGKNLGNTDIILSLISPDFMYSEHEIWQKSVEMNKAKGAIVVPIIIRPILQIKDMFLGLNVLPSNSESISTAPNRDRVWVKVAEEVQKIVHKILIEKYLKKAEESILGKQPSKSLIYCEEAINIDNTVSISFFTKGNALYHLEKYEEALESYKKAIELNPKEASYYAKIGDILCNRLKFQKEALESYKKAIELNPKEASYYAKIGDILAIFMKKPKEALESYKKAIELNPKEASYYDKYGYILYNDLQRYKDAIYAYGIAIELNPKEASYYDKIGDILFNDLDDPENALREYIQASELNPEEPSYHDKIGDILIYCSNYREAILAYKRASELNPKEPSYYIQIGSVLDKYLELPEEAIDVYKRASELNPEEPSYHRRIGDLLFFKLERYMEAVYSYKRASELNPEEPSYHDLQAQVYEKLARQMRQKAAELKDNKNNRKFGFA